MIEINAKVIKDVERRLGQYKSKAPIVLYLALNRAASNLNTNLKRETRKRYVIKQKDIKLAVTKASRFKLSAVVKSEGERIPLDKFKVSPNVPRHKNPPKSLKVQVKKDGIKELFHAFVVNINGNKVFERRDKAHLPIDKLFGPAIPQMIRNKETVEYAEKEAIKTYEKRLDHEIKRVLEGN